jgi:hypothetical protein
MLKSLGVVAPIVGAAGISTALSVSAHADVDLAASDDPLLGSTNAILLGGTAEPTPSTAYVDAAESLYLEPLGFCLLSKDSVFATSPAQTPRRSTSLSPISRCHNTIRILHSLTQE